MCRNSKRRSRKQKNNHQCRRRISCGGAFLHFGGDRIYIYPDNLNAKATLWLWQLRDLAVIGIGLLIAVLALTQLGLFLPMVLVAAYAFLSIHLDAEPFCGWSRARYDGCLVMRSSLLSAGRSCLPMKKAPTFRADADNVYDISLFPPAFYFAAFL